MIMRFIAVLMLVSPFISTLYVRADGDDWMSNIPDDKYLSELTIPGTHNSYARFGHESDDTFDLFASAIGRIANLATKPFAKCQDWTIKKQLEQGIRFFDVRFRPYKHFFTVHHGDIFQQAYGGDVFKDFKNFLKKNPTETVLISYKDETNGNTRIDPEPGSEDFKTILKSYLYDNRYKPWIYQNHTFIPRLGEARGKMVFIDKEGHGGWGLPRYKLEVKDDWKSLFYAHSIPGVGAKVQVLNPIKISGIQKNMRDAGKSHSKLYMTFCSGSDAIRQSNRAVANMLNPKVQSYVRSFSGNKNEVFGAVIFDFPTPAIIRSLIQHNPGQKKICATLEPEDRDSSWIVEDGYMSSYLGTKWNDNIGYVNLGRKCFLTAYVDMHFKGTKNHLYPKRDKHLWRKNDNDYLIDDDGWIGHWWSNDISSFKCECR